MTIISEQIIRNGRKLTTVPVRPARHVKEPEPTPALVVYARWSALAITVGIAAASFVLSFATLTNLARRAGIAPQLAWLWPLTVDGTIVQATIAIVALAAYEGYLSSRKFFWVVLISAAAVSVLGNVLYPFIGAHMPTILAAAVMCIAPLSLLATTHGLAKLSQFRPEEEK